VIEIGRLVVNVGVAKKRAHDREQAVSLPHAGGTRASAQARKIVCAAGRDRRVATMTS
jgi:hypothetical protein